MIDDVPACRRSPLRSDGESEPNRFDHIIHVRRIDHEACIADAVWYAERATSHRYASTHHRFAQHVGKAFGA
jgi:hypothetical protein